MGIIKQLPESIAIKIAAGEVVERPASVVKELVENALDAGATRIEVALEEGGKTRIEVKDNGSGMDRDDAVSAFLRHGTSKISAVEDLAHVTTLGFRGEALAAIAASAEVELITTLKSASEGTRVHIDHGLAQPAKPHAPLEGTTITVARLFAALPARQKFLKSEATEWKACLDTLLKQALAHPEVAFLIKHNKKTVYDLPVHTSFLGRVAEVWKVAPSLLVEVSAETPHMQLTGVIAKPEVAHEGKSRQYLAVNKHPVVDKMLARSIKEAFGTLLPPTLYPAYALNLQLHPGMVDVNIHPRKDEVRFINSQEAYRFMLHAVSQALPKESLAFATLPNWSPPVPRSEVPRAQPSLAMPVAPISSLRSFSSPVRRAAFEATPFVPTVAPNTTEPEVFEPVLVVDHCYLITLHDDTLLLIDQHAAHERVLYNQLWDADAKKERVSQPLLLPVELDLDPSEAALFETHRAAFEALGFGFSSEGLALQEVPHIIKKRDPATFFHELLSGLVAGRTEPELKEFKHTLFATMACKAAIKAGDRVSEAEQRRLVADLLAMPDRFTCPHGRPSHIAVTGGELEKLFKRTGF